MKSESLKLKKNQYVINLDVKLKGTGADGTLKTEKLYNNYFSDMHDSKCSPSSFGNSQHDIL